MRNKTALVLVCGHIGLRWRILDIESRHEKIVLSKHGNSAQMQHRALSRLLAVSLCTVLAQAQSGDGGAADGASNSNLGSGAAAGAEGPSNSGLSLSRGAIIAIAVVVAIVVLGGGKSFTSSKRPAK